MVCDSQATSNDDERTRKDNVTATKSSTVRETRWRLHPENRVSGRSHAKIIADGNKISALLRSVLGVLGRGCGSRILLEARVAQDHSSRLGSGRGLLGWIQG